MNEVWPQIATYISIPYLLTFILLSYLVKKYLEHVLEKITRFKWRTVYTVLFLGILLAVPFLIWTEASWVQVLFSYAVGTSLHELCFRYIEKLFIKKK